MLRGFVFVVLALYALLPPGVCACRLDAILWAALTPETLPNCIDDPYEHDHHCPGAKKLFVSSDSPCVDVSSYSMGINVDNASDAGAVILVAAAGGAPNDPVRPSPLVMLCALRI
jgi:hypothetical protein